MDRASTQLAERRMIASVWALSARARAGPVLLVAHLLHPVDRLSVERLLDGDVHHRRGRRRAVPVLLPGREPHHVSRADLLDRTAFALHQTERAAWIFGAAQRLRDAIGDSIAPANLPGYEQTVAALQAALGAAAFEVAWAKGRALPLEHVVAAALAQEER